MKQSIFELLVCTFNQEPIKDTNFDCLYLKTYFEIFKTIKFPIAQIKLNK